MLKPVLRIASLALLLALPACTKLTIAWTDLKPDGDAATPPVLAAFAGAAPVTTPEQWRSTRAPALREALQREVYGFMPDAAQTKVISHKVINPSAFGGKAVLEEYRLAVTATFNGVSVETQGADESAGFFMDVALPKNATGPTPIILMETFCSRWNTLPDAAVAGAPEEQETGGGVMTYIFGRYICTPPVEAILDAGYGIATIFPSEIVPDKAEAGLEQLRRLSAGHEDDDTRWGMIRASTRPRSLPGGIRDTPNPRWSPPPLMTALTA